MIRGRRVCALVPARGGSKGIPRKNLLKIGGMTLLERALTLAQACPTVDRVYVSTDDAEAYALAKLHGCDTPHLRPATLATDRSRTIDVVRHLVREGPIGADDIILLVQPTSPIRTREELNAICDLLDRTWDETDAIVSVCKIDGPHPYKAQLIENGVLRSLFGAESTVPRQSLPETFLPNGAFYLGKYSVLDAENTFIPARSLAYIMPPLASVNLDGPLDQLLLEALLEKGMVQLDSPEQTTQQSQA